MLRKIKKNSILTLSSILSLLVVFTACSTDDEGPEEEPEVIIEPVNKSTGFVFAGSTSSGTVLTKYFEEIPTGTIDLSDGKDFSRFNPTSVFDNALFMPRTDGASGFAKMVVNAEGEIIEEGIIATVASSSFRVEVKDSETGVFQDRATPNIISVFNPATLEVTGTIDMSAGFVPGDIDQRYQRFIFRGDDVFAPIRGDINGDNFPSFIVHQANLATNTFVGDTQRDGNGVSPIVTVNNFGQRLTDEAGNLYLSDAGNYEGAGLPGRVNRILAGSNEIDPDYIFEPAAILNPANVFLPTFNDFDVVENGKAIAVVNNETPQAAIDIVIAAGGIDNLSNDQVQEIFAILFSAESAVWCELDLETKTVTPIVGIPDVGVFNGGTTFEYNGDIYIPALTSAESAYYKWNPATGTASKAFVVTGADTASVYNIANNN